LGHKGIFSCRYLTVRPLSSVNIASSIFTPCHKESTTKATAAATFFRVSSIILRAEHLSEPSTKAKKFRRHRKSFNFFLPFAPLALSAAAEIAFCWHKEHTHLFFHPMSKSGENLLALSFAHMHRIGERKCLHIYTLLFGRARSFLWFAYLQRLKRIV
jgi:hypothetical protein